MEAFLSSLNSQIGAIRPYEVFGRVSAVRGLMIEISGTQSMLSVGDRCRIYRDADINRITVHADESILAEVIGFREGRALAMAYDQLTGIMPGAKVSVIHQQASIYPSEAWLGRTIDALGEPLDGFGPLIEGDQEYKVKASPLPAHERNRVGERIDLGVKSLNAFATCCRGQRMGIFSGSGVGKSTLLSMIARFTEAEVIVIGLIGERGREVQDFIIDDLGIEGLKRAVVVVSTSDESALKRREAANMTLSIAEYFRDQGRQVMCLMDSITRFAMAQREIGLSVGEPPSSKGYTPTVFAELPRLLERAGPGIDEGSITGLFTVLVEGDDLNEPVSDAVRGILDGHIVLSREIAHRNRYPSIDVLSSISRMMPDCNSDEENTMIDQAKKLLSTYRDMEELIRIGAYRKGSDDDVDTAIYFNNALEAFLQQKKNESFDMGQTFADLRSALGIDDETPSEAPSGDH